MTPEQIALLSDARLSDAARVLGLYVSSLPEGPHELSHDQLAALIHGTPNADTVGRHMRQLAVHGYVERTSPGGKGSPRYQWSARENSREDKPMPAKIHGETPVVVGEEVDTNPLNPPSLSVRALQAIDAAGEKLRGCRGALRDYLEARVPAERQYPYVQWVVTTLDNPLAYYRMPTGLPIPHDQRTAVLADALNQLAATDEDKTRKWDAGDPANLENKIRSVVRSWSPPEERKATGTDGKPWRGKAEKKPQDEQEYTPKRWTGEFNR